jgi:hypothetical protein
MIIFFFQMKTYQPNINAQINLTHECISDPYGGIPDISSPAMVLLPLSV